jgi:hypothetical protein
MIQISNMLWLFAIFFAILGFQRGWNKEVAALAGIALGMFALFQFDALLRGTVLAIFSSDQVFIIQAVIFCLWSFYVYQFNLPETEDARGRANPNSTNRADNLQEAILGGLLGFFNGYTLWGGLWYLLDINEYPFAPYITAPAPGSATDQSLNLIPLVLFSGGVNGSGDLLAVLVVILFLLVLVIL